MTSQDYRKRKVDHVKTGFACSVFPTVKDGSGGMAGVAAATPFEGRKKEN